MICGGTPKHTIAWKLLHRIRVQSIMEDMPITRGNGHVPLATLTVPRALTDASPPEPPRYARSDDMLMPDRLLRFDKSYPHDCTQVCATLYGNEQDLEDFRAEPTCSAAQGKPEGQGWLGQRWVGHEVE